MATRLINVVQFTGLVVGVPTLLPHLLNIDGRAVIPDLVIPASGGVSVTADATSVTVTRLTGADPTAADILTWSWNSPDRVFGTVPPPGTSPDGSLTPQPFVLNQAGAGSAIWQLSVQPVDVAGPITAAVNELRQVDTTAGGFVVNLPAITAGNSGIPIVIKKVSADGNTATITPNGGDTIDGSATLALTAVQGSFTLVGDGVSDWKVI